MNTMENSDKEKIEQIIRLRKQANAVYLRKLKWKVVRLRFQPVLQ